MSRRTILSAESNSVEASVRANSVLPTPVGPRNRKLPIGLRGSLIPARARRIASETSVTASSWPTTLSCKTSSRRSSFSRSPSTSRVTGTPVHFETMSAISSCETSSFKSAPSLASTASSACSFSSSSGILPCRSWATVLRSYSRSAFSMAIRVTSSSSRTARISSMAPFSLSHCARNTPTSSRTFASSLESTVKRALEASSFSFFKAASSISSCSARRVSASSSCGMLSISVRISAQASSTRSIALSGKKRSVI